jgi:hypothetical protein
MPAAIRDAGPLTDAEGRRETSPRACTTARDLSAPVAADALAGYRAGADPTSSD